MGKPIFFHNRLSIRWYQFFTDNRNVVIIWNYRWTLHRPGLYKVPCWRYLLHNVLFVFTLKDL